MSRREKRRKGAGLGAQQGAGLMRFFEDAGVGPKINPGTAIIMASLLITIVMMAHLGVFGWIF